MDALPMIEEVEMTPEDNTWQNSSNPLDVNNDSQVTPLDALLVINELTDPGLSDPDTGKLPEAPSYCPGMLLDVDGDGHVSRSDAQQVIDYLNATSAVDVDTSTPALEASDTQLPSLDDHEESSPGQGMSVVRTSARDGLAPSSPPVQDSADTPNEPTARPQAAGDGLDFQTRVPDRTHVAEERLRQYGDEANRTLDSSYTKPNNMALEPILSDVADDIARVWQDQPPVDTLFAGTGH